MTPNAALNRLVDWFATISDGSWGPNNLEVLLNSMLVPANERAALKSALNQMLKSPACRLLLRNGYGIDIKYADVDGQVASVRFRREGKAPLRPEPAPAPTPKTRDPRLPSVGTPIVTEVGYGVKASAIETSEGTFKVLFADTDLGEATSISGAARLIWRAQNPFSDGKSINGFRFFKLNGPWAERKPEIPVPSPEVVKTPTEPRPSAIYGVEVIHHDGIWLAVGHGLVGTGDTPNKAMTSWDTLFLTGKPE